MPSNLTTYGDISPRTAGCAAKKLLERGQVDLLLERFGQFDPQGKNKTTTRKFRRYEALAHATAPLAEGVTPAGQKLTCTDIECVLQQYGDWVQITDVIADTHEDPVLTDAMDNCGTQAAETVELVRYDVLKGGSNVFYANGATTRIALASPPTRGDFRKIYRAFKNNRGKELSEIISATAKIATQPVGKSYFALCHTDLDADLRGIAGFVPVENYASSEKAMMGEIGKIENFRILTSPLFTPWLAAATTASTQSTYLSNGAVTASGSADVYPILFIAKNAYGIVPLQGKNAVTPMVKNPGQPTSDDPLGQRGFVSWKTWQTTIILNQLWIARLECCATANPS